MPIVGLVVVCLIGVVGCTTHNSSDVSNSISVSNMDDQCLLNSIEAPSGTLSFVITNKGTKVTEFYLLGDDGLRVVGEAENIGPGLTRTLVVSAREGSYFTVCKPGMKGDGIRATFTVTKGISSGQSEEFDALLKTATDQYGLYVRQQSEELLARTREFANMYELQNDDAARSLYPIARTFWERIEPVAESFGDLDPRLDLREADLQGDEEWTGWHRIEKDLWPDKAGTSYVKLTKNERIEIAKNLVNDTVELNSRITTLTFDPTQLGNGAKELLDEVATGKVTGEEEVWSETDLWDFQANVDGARIAFEVLEEALRSKNAELADKLKRNFALLQEILDSHRQGDGFVLYSKLTRDEIADLSDAVNALSEPLAQLTAAVMI